MEQQLFQTILRITHAFAAPGTYNVKLYLNDTTYCNSPDSLVKQLRVATVLVAQFETPAIGCSPYNAVFNNTSLGGQNLCGILVMAQLQQTHIQHIFIKTRVLIQFI